MKTFYFLLSSLVFSGCVVEISVSDLIEVTAQHNSESLTVVVNNEVEYDMEKVDEEFVVDVASDATQVTMFFHDGQKVVIPTAVRVNGYLVCMHDEHYEFAMPVTQDCGEVVVNDVYVALTGKHFGIATLTEKWEQWQNAQLLDAQNGNVSWRTIDIEALSFEYAREVNEYFNSHNPETTTAVYVNVQELFPDNPARVWQQSVYDEIVSDYPEFIFRQSNGEVMSVWEPMVMMNMRADGPKVDGKNYINYIADKIANRVESLGDGIVHEVHLDNYNYVQQWIYLQHDFEDSDPWEYDEQQRKGRRELAITLRQRLDISVSARASTHKFNDVIDAVVIEQGVRTPAIPGGLFEHLFQGQLICGGVARCVLHHNYSGDDEAQLLAEVETGRAMSLILGADFAFDRQGDQGHGDFEMIGVMDVKVGKPIGVIQEFPAPKFFKNTFVLRDGETFVVPATRGDVIVAYTDVMDGKFGQSAFTGVFENEDNEHKGFFWDSGLRSEVTQHDNPDLRFTGVGSVEVTRLTVYEKRPLLVREFENATVYLNTDIDPITYQGIQIPGQSGRVIPH